MRTDWGQRPGPGSLFSHSLWRVTPRTLVFQISNPPVERCYIARLYAEESSTWLITFKLPAYLHTWGSHLGRRHPVNLYNCFVVYPLGLPRDKRWALHFHQPVFRRNNTLPGNHYNTSTVVKWGNTSLKALPEFAGQEFLKEILQRVPHTKGIGQGLILWR